MAHVGGVVRDRALREYPLDQGERVGTAAEVGRPALGHARRVEGMRHGNGARAGSGQVRGQPVDHGMPPFAELLRIARGLQPPLVRASSLQDARGVWSGRIGLRSMARVTLVIRARSRRSGRGRR